MRGLSAQDLLDIWDQGQGLSPSGRAALLLSVACPEYPRPRVDAMTLGERDALLAQIRTRTFGQDLASVAACPACREMVEVSIDMPSLFPDGTSAVSSEATSRTPLRIEADDFVVWAAIPTVRDLDTCVTAATPAEALGLLIRRCIVRAERSGNPCDVDDLPEEVRVLIDTRLAEQDPQGAIYLSLHCPACDHRWSLLFDLRAYFWIEIQTGARRLLREVHALASVYGWRESDILALSPWRRRAYLDLVGG